MSRALALRGDIRQEIIAAAGRLLARYGYKKMTMEDVAQEVGIGKGTIYLHFPSKEELALAHIDSIVDGVKAELTRIAAEDQSPADRIERMLIARVMIRFETVQQYTESLSDLLAAIRPSLLQRRKRHFEEEAILLAGVLREGQARGAFVLSDARETAYTLLAATNSLLPYSLSKRELGSRTRIQEQARRIGHLLLTGLITR